MMYFVLIILLLVILIIILKVIRHFFHHPRINYINIVSGANGTGKTSSTMCQTISLLRKLYFLGKDRKQENDYIVLSNFPVGLPHYASKEDKKKGIPDYRYLRIWNHKIKCYDLNLNIFTQLEKLPQNEVIILCDEFSKIASQFDYNNPVISNNMDDFFGYFRHYTKGKGYIFAIDQCSSNIFFQIRRRSEYCYNMVSCKKLLLLPITIFEYRKILLSDEVQNITEVKDTTDENEIKRFIFFSNPFKWYDSYCYSERYQYITHVMQLMFRPTFKRNSVMKLIQRTPLYYENLKGDNITEDDYLKSFEKEKRRNKNYN